MVSRKGKELPSTFNTLNLSCMHIQMDGTKYMPNIPKVEYPYIGAIIIFKEIHAILDCLHF